MFEVGIYEAKSHLPQIVRRVENGEECIVTRRGKAVAKFVPIEQKQEDIAKAWKKIRAFNKKNPINATLEEIMAWKNEGRM